MSFVQRLPQTLEEAHELLVAQARRLVHLEGENRTLQGALAALQTQVQELQARLNQNSSNSSKPPSSDPPGRPPRPTRPPTGRAAGGQPGHPGHSRNLRPLTQVDRVVELRPLACGHCGTLLLGDDPQPARHQVTDLPVVRPTVTEYRRHTLTCLACGEATTEAWPAAMPGGAFGPRTQATVGYLTGRLGLSQREAAEALETVCGLELGLGSIAALEQRLSGALAGPMAEAQEALQRQPVANVDETSWWERGKRRWLWVAATPRMTVFAIDATRGAAGAKRMLGEGFAGIVGSDRWSGYRWLDLDHRQVCWAHLARDFRGLVDWGGAAKPVGAALVALTERVFTLWHGARADPLARRAFPATMRPLQDEFQALFATGQMGTSPKAAGLCRRLLDRWPALWTFVTVAGVEPTNNGAERPLRRAVLWRRRSFGTQSEAGSRFVERILTAVTTLRQQRRDVLAYLTEASAAAIRSDVSPSLLPLTLMPGR